jgi:hypothetical protein
MATVNLGSIKFKWKGTYAGATAYTIDDVVSYNGSSYICIQASTGNLPTDTAYFEQMSSAGTNGTDGTDLGTTLTTQGDILYRDGSGLQRLGAGTSGNVLTTKGSGQNPVWEPAVGGKIGQVVVTTKTDTTSTGSSSYADVSGMSASITPSATSSKILWRYDCQGGSNVNYAQMQIVYGNGSNLTTQAIGDTAGSRVIGTTIGLYDGGNDVGIHWSMQGIDSPNTTSATIYKLQWKVKSGDIYLNRSAYDPDDSNGNRGISTLTLMEVLV